MKIDNIHSIYFLGIGGIGMSALARYFKAMGKNVSGYDKTTTLLTSQLISEGIGIHFEDNVNLIDDVILNLKTEEQKKQVLVVYTPALPKDHKEYNFFSQNGFTVKKRSEVLGLITEDSFNIAVAGTHGKTTTSSMVAHLLTQSDIGCSAFLGGITQNYGTNLLLNAKSKFTVVEADEYDRSFLTLSPDIAIITSVDADHLDIYGERKAVEESFALFSKKVKSGGKLIVKKGLDLPLDVLNAALTYSLRTKADFYAENIRVVEGSFVFDFKSDLANIEDLSFDMPGRHNVENAVVAIAASLLCGVKKEDIKKALTIFKGVKRRFEYQIKTENLVFIDDYAHHPEELKACINAVKELYPGKKITGVFQPHLYSRTRDFADGFASSLDLLDECILLNIYPARELPITGVTSQMLIDRMKLKAKCLMSNEELLRYTTENDLQVLITMGAGDIDKLVAPIKENLINKI